MRIRTVKYHIRQGILGLWKHRLMSLASFIAVAAFAFFLILSLSLVINLDYVLQQIESSIGISVFLGDELTDEEIQQLEQKIKGIEHVTRIEYLSKESALKWAQENWEKSDILKGLNEGDNPLPRSFDVYIDGAKYEANVTNALKDLQVSYEKEVVNKRISDGKVNDVLKAQDEYSENSDAKGTEETTEAVTEGDTQQLGKEIVDSIGKKGYKYIGIENIRHAQKESEVIVNISTILRIISIVITLLMCMISFGIIMNTIKITVYIRKNEINIMKYVGATDWFIRWPFIVEGIIIGIVGALIPIIICGIGYDGTIALIYQKFPVILKLANFKSASALFSVVTPITLLAGLLIGTFGSITSIKKHLNV